mmetsp:Transcript_34544/g.71907  ORF Transcript_34544/g.71907 Transcript_34544/m.71907 type:complete len:187 (+) Transcript_34544:721-1281(+)
MNVFHRTRTGFEEWKDAPLFPLEKFCERERRREQSNRIPRKALVPRLGLEFKNMDKLRIGPSAAASSSCFSWIQEFSLRFLWSIFGRFGKPRGQWFNMLQNEHLRSATNKHLPSDMDVITKNHWRYDNKMSKKPLDKAICQTSQPREERNSSTSLLDKSASKKERTIAKRNKPTLEYHNNSLAKMG